MDCGFLRLPTNPELETIFLEQDRLLVILPEDHALANCERFPVKALCNDPFMLLEKGAKANTFLYHFLDTFLLLYITNTRDCLPEK